LAWKATAVARYRGDVTVTVDGIDQVDQAIPLVDDRQEHSVEVSDWVTGLQFSISVEGTDRKN